MIRGRDIVLGVALFAALLGVFAVTTLHRVRQEGRPLAAREKVFEDVLGHIVRWKEPPARIISLSPNLTEMLFALGFDERDIVGRTRFCDYPAAAERIPAVGGIVDPNLELITAQEPDLVLVTRGVPLETMTSLEELGVSVYAVETRGEIDQIITNVKRIGAVTGRADAGEAIARDLEQRIDRVAARTRGLEEYQRPRVFYGELEGPHWTAGPGSFLHALIELAGGANVAASAPAAWAPLGLETIVAADPEVYLGSFDAGSETVAEGQRRVREMLQNHEGWRATRLGQDAMPRIMLVSADRLLRPGPRVIDVLEEFARFLHPDLWDDARKGERQ